MTIPVDLDAARSERFTVDRLDGVTLRARHFGRESDPLLVLLHGGGANAHWWDHLAPTLAENHHVVAMDFRGHGDSDYPERVEVGAFDRDLDALLDHLGDPGALLVGHSMGAHIAVGRAARCRSQRGVVAIEISRGSGRSDRRRTRLALAARRTYPTYEEAVRRFQFVPRARGVDPDLRVASARQSVLEEEDGRFGFKFDARWFSLPPADPPDFARIACPVLVIRGADSNLLTSQGTDELAALIPDSRSVAIAGAGHNVHVERPRQVLSAVESFLAPLR
ncbi:MAG: alpha/beta fold hydrolase [Myxococcota bacterium]